MSAARHMIALLKSHLEGDDKEVLSVAMQAAAHEARLGHIAIAQQLRDLIDESKRRSSAIQIRPGQLVVLEPRGELANLLSVQTPSIRFSDMALPETLAERLKRVLLEQRQQKRLREHSLSPRRKLVFLGPPGSGKTMTASALAGELHLPLFTIMLEGLITKFMGETAAKLRLVFEAIRQTQGVYLFDEFDALGAHRSQANDVGEIRRVLNSFLQLLEIDDSQSLVVAATNHPELLDRALFRRFDDVIEYKLPDPQLAEEILRRKLAMFQTADIDWPHVLPETEGLSQAELVRASEEAAKKAVLGGSTRITSEALVAAVHERKQPPAKCRNCRAISRTSICEETGGRNRYTTRLRARSRPLPQRDRAEHAEAVRFALAGAMAEAQVQRAEREPDILTGTHGFYLDFELPLGSEDAAERLENRQKHIELVAVRPESGESPARATVFVPDTAADHFFRKVEQYRDEETRIGKPKNEALIARIQSVVLAAVRSVYTDDAALFPAAGETIWWEIWLRRRNSAA